MGPSVEAWGRGTVLGDQLASAAEEGDERERESRGKESVGKENLNKVMGLW